MVLFSLPFAFIGLHLLWTAAMYAAGKLTVTRRGDDLALFTGIGPIGKTRRLSAAGVVSVEEHVKLSRGKHGVSSTRTAWIRNKDGTDLKLGDLLNPGRRAWVIGMLRRMIMG
jgi:hypothetical protein